MWSREQLKANAKAALSRNYWVTFAVSTLAFLLTGGWMAPKFGHYRLSHYVNWHNFHLNLRWDLMPRLQWLPRFLKPLGPIVLGWAVTMTLFGLFLAIIYLFFAANPVRVGQNRYFITNRNSHCDFLQLFSPFFRGGYLNIVRTMAGVCVRVFLWSLLFLIPGIYKAYSYRLVPYILAENPQISPRRALEISERTMVSEKLDTFVLDLSFIGWYILGTLACGIGVFFVFPYVQATSTELYGVLRYKAISTGICSPSELSPRA